ncbi:tryptophan-rich sensory protein [Paenibacillus sp. ACRRX]|uniref:tryptophan-rich sensory protein n=1 Tax=Paenibacillus sp. ACRRX TaxID=2918206 RepID=UPI001EF4576F|nr:tryptophan-rich sensory protein [Paenibacillus sp. ACRRX]MCG7408646.1 tryptophan-rich sensory protein [Paenibacillus sp. ACRRX]
MQSASAWKWMNLLTIVAVIAINALANLIPFNGKTTGEISAMFPVLITPAPFTFSIWGLIYVLLIGFAIYQILPGSSSTASQIGPLFVLSNLFNIAWLLLWHYAYHQVWLSLIAMAGLFVSLIFIYANVRRNELSTKGGRWFVRLPFSIYLAWICVAMIVNTAVVLYDREWNGMGLSQEVWTVIGLAVGALLAWLVGGPNRDSTFVLVFVWAYVGIAVANHSNVGIFYTALGLGTLLALFAITLPFRSKRGAAYTL